MMAVNFGRANTNREFKVRSSISFSGIMSWRPVSHPFTVKLWKGMWDYQLEIGHGAVGNEHTTTVQLVKFLKKQIADSKRAGVHDWVWVLAYHHQQMERITSKSTKNKAKNNKTGTSEWKRGGKTSQIKAGKSSVKMSTEKFNWSKVKVNPSQPRGQVKEYKFRGAGNSNPKLIYKDREKRKKKREDGLILNCPK
ncbi:hypothetical protein Tco_0842308 [Tanacetum coccineum]|uniref:Uncharacterized protein n=1 Tax=Tanacetum coccineum TaxID=301880 RepID=A0ABQ5B323_9ASTR